MVLRHAMFYFNWGIVEEFGTNQPILGLILIPITSIFGSLFLYNRKELKLNQYDLIKMILIGCLPFILNHSEIIRTVLYTVGDSSRRPIFLILTPIAISGLIKQFLPIKTSIIILAIVYLFTNNFILHYTLILLVINVFSIRSIKPINIHLANLLIGIPLFFFFSASRINLLSEVLLTMAALNVLTIISSNLKFVVPKISILYFYFFQAVLFTILSKSTLNQYLSILLIFILSISFGIMLSQVEKKLKRHLGF